MTTMRTAAGSAAGSLSQHYPPMPASPTLTNPDMILPDYDRAPSPAGLDDSPHRAQSPLTMWKNAQAGDPGPFRNFTAGPITPTTPIIYGNGTMLSDIGEVTEAESTPGKSSSGSRRYTAIRSTAFDVKDRDSGSDVALRSSPTMGMNGTYGGIKKRAKENAAQRERRSSMDSNSTITTQEQAALFADFDDSLSVGDSVFQGDDEESLASSYVDDSPASHDHAALYGTGSSSGLDSDADRRRSTASLSRRAEQILANAKKRLTTMEGNLSRARTSLAVVSPSYLGSDGSTPSPPIARASTALTLSTTTPSSPSSISGHRRLGSDNSLRIGLPIRVHSQRSVSAFGTPDGYRQPLTSSKSVDHLNGQYSRQRAVSMIRDSALAPLSEDDMSQQSSLGRANRRDKRLSYATSYSELGLKRSGSVMQMSDLKDHMKDLKGKISSLREQARADSLKRRSLQSLRTPSPFTHAQVDQWATESSSAPSPPSGSGSGNDSSGTSPRSGEPPRAGGDSPTVGSIETYITTEDDELENTSSSDDAYIPVTEMNHHILVPNGDTDEPIFEEEEEQETDSDDLLTENGDFDDEQDGPEAGQDAGVDRYDLESESGESLYHDTVQQQMSHEDREDAFDYEHFFLHSAMGSISQQRLGRRGSEASFGSEGSVETTRGPPMSATGNDGSDKPRTVSRRTSATSISTIESFATAQEGLWSRQGSRAGGSEKGEAIDEFPELLSTSSIIEELPESPESPESPQTAKRATFAGISSPYASPARSSSDEQRTSRLELMSSAMRRPMSSSAATAHRPSVSSFESTGTTRSFPLVNKTKKAASTGILTPGASPDQDLKTLADSLMSDTASICDEINNGSTTSSTGHKHSVSLSGATTSSAAMQSLMRDDQFLVERLVASLGRCVLGMTESGRASTESRMYRRRIDAARRILEGIDPI